MLWCQVIIDSIRRRKRKKERKMIIRYPISYQHFQVVSPHVKKILKWILKTLSIPRMTAVARGIEKYTNGDYKNENLYTI